MPRFGDIRVFERLANVLRALADAQLELVFCQVQIFKIANRARNARRRTVDEHLKANKAMK